MKIKYYSLAFLWLVSCWGYAQNVVINDIYISGNRQSRASVILRELTFSKGDTLSPATLQRRIQFSQDNLLNTSLFNYVYISDTIRNDISPPLGGGGLVDIHIKVEERWYIWPVIDLVFEDRNISTWIRHPDWSRFSFGAGVNIDNMRGLNENLNINARIGYQRGVSLSYSDIALDRAKRHLLGISTSYNRIYNAAYTTENNKPVYATTDGRAIRERYTAGVNYSYRPQLRERHSAGLSYDHTAIDDTLITLNPSYWGGSNTRRSTVSAMYAYASDYRDSYVYPLKGTLWKVTAHASTALDGNLIAGSLLPEINTYLPLTRRWFYAGSLSAKLSVANRQAYTVTRALGYENNYLRGYEDYVMDGDYYVLFKNTLRFLVMPTKTVEIKWLSALYKFNKIHFTIYANVFADYGYSHNKYAAADNTLQNIFLYSGGVGLDLVTYYDIVFRIDYSINKMREGGFYITLITPFF
jgi:outer membrane protein assembly factor BamA